MKNVREIFGNIDIYLFDQILKGRFENREKILDAGCGGGRNLWYFLNSGFDVYGIDLNYEAIESLKLFAASQNLSKDNFQISTVEKMPFADDFFDAVLSSAVLHFAENKLHFEQMLFEMWRVLKPNGIFFARLASSIGIENLLENVGNGRYCLPDGSERFLVDEKMLLDYAEKLNADLIEPIKTTNVQNLRCMTTWVLLKT